MLRCAVVFLLWGLCGGCAEEPVLSVSNFVVRVGSGGKALPVSLPCHLDDILPAHPTTYTLSTRVELPAEMRGKALTVAIPYLLAHAKLWVDGQPMIALDPEFTPTYRSLGTLRFHIPSAVSARGVLALSLQVRHTWTRSGWLETPVRISATPAGDRFSHAVLAFNLQSAWFGCVTVYVICLISLLVYLLDRRQIAFVWFAVESFFGNVMPLFQMGTAKQLFGTYDAVVMAAGVSIGLWSSVRFTHVQFGLGRPHRVFDLMLALTIGLLISAPGPFEATQRAGGAVIVFIVVNVVYQIVVALKQYKESTRPVHALVIAASWATLGVAASADGTSWTGLGELWGGMHGGPLGLAVIALLQGAVLSHDFITTQKREDALNLELVDRVRMLETKDLENSALNEALRRQIAARSEQLAHAVVRFGATRTPTGEAAELTVGSVLEQRYRVVGVLGRGGMGTVYEVARVIDDKHFALKVLSGRGGAVEVARFAREAQLVAQLQHPNVVSIVDVDVATNGFLFIVLELVRGESLRAHMQRAAQDRRFALSALAQIADGLAAIHRARIIHRDLKPENVLVVAAGSEQIDVKITDFGVSIAASAARESDSVAPPVYTYEEHEGKGDVTTAVGPGVEGELHDLEQGLTRAGVVVGTPRYLAPEAGQHTSPALDIYAFGVMAFEMLAGHPPFSEPLLILRISRRSLPPPPSLARDVPDVPVQVLEMVQRCLLVDPAARPTADELRDTFRGSATGSSRA